MQPVLPHELVARYLAPRLRVLVALRLREQGLGQERIARLLGVSQPMVSRYLRSSLDSVLSALEELGVEREEALSVGDTLASLLLKGDVEGYVRYATLYANSVLARGGLCRLHGGPPGCSICGELFQAGPDPYIVEVEEAARLLSQSPGAHLLIPNVGSNIVAAKPGASSIADIVGLTGGVFREGNRVAIVGRPAYGGSRHTARVLLAAYKRWRSRRAAFVAAYRRECMETLTRAGLRLATAGPHSGPSRLVEEIEAALAAQEEPVDVLVDVGGMGVEPVVYIFSESAPKAVSLAMSCIQDR